MCDTNGIVECIKHLLASYNTPVENCFGFSSDGASVMTGKDNGVAAILKKTHCPHMISVHCVAHRLALATSQAAGDMKRSLELFTAILNSLHHEQISLSKCKKYLMTHRFNWRKYLKFSLCCGLTTQSNGFSYGYVGSRCR